MYNIKIYRNELEIKERLNLPTLDITLTASDGWVLGHKERLTYYRIHKGISTCIYRGYSKW